MFNFFKKKDEGSKDPKSLAEKAARSRDPREAVELYSEAIKLEKEKANPDNLLLSEIYRLRGDVYFSQGVAILSSSDYLHAIENNPQNGIAHNNLGLWFTIEHFTTPDFPRALEHLHLAIIYCPDRPDFVMNRAIVKIKNGDKEQGKADLEALYANGFADAKIAMERFC